MKKSYEKPIVEVMDARVEKGFAGSNAPTSPEFNSQGTQDLYVGEEYFL